MRSECSAADESNRAGDWPPSSLLVAPLPIPSRLPSLPPCILQLILFAKSLQSVSSSSAVQRCDDDGETIVAVTPG